LPLAGQNRIIRLGIRPKWTTLRFKEAGRSGPV
jgi:hypothetical protein